MKKILLSLILVVALSSYASAALIGLQISSLNGQPIDPVSEITIFPSDVINFDIVYTSEGAGKLFVLDTEVVVDGPGTLDLADLTWPYDEGLNQVVGNIINTASFGTGMSDGILVDHLLLHCDALGDVILSLAPSVSQGGTAYYPNGDPYDGQWGSVRIIQIPEPMTMALLGLGGLALIRRRR